MSSLMRFVKVISIIGCLAFVLNIGGVRHSPVCADESCVDMVK